MTGLHGFRKTGMGETAARLPKTDNQTITTVPLITDPEAEISETATGQTEVNPRREAEALQV